jgi:hypothetical protein
MSARVHDHDDEDSPRARTPDMKKLPHQDSNLE